ncbi:hypothetical protein AB1Y20_014941 [Prymnesium parvum]|uniref:PIPK domain-containing protein n=1 Tax=Prymnesium parvum TaxID=97485 RepID=A0AB34JWD3_PRYPA|mmetsp:Transcript_18073/g.38519  ORF Transcript_18073/g.38519 Transcript_18073/m.38519 type:complete len:556 (+) Transcript_18073:80-1747(+)
MGDTGGVPAAAPAAACVGPNQPEESSSAEGGRMSIRMNSPIKVQPAKQRIRHRKVRQGQTIYKGHPSWNIMLNIKLGISYTVGRITPEENRKLKHSDFTDVYKQVFSPEGSTLTPGHNADVFTFKDHAPLAFRHLREHWGVDAQEYMVSICGEHSLRELGTPGKSGAVFYLTEDNKFLIKTVSRKESKFLRQILPNYYNYVMRSANTLVPRFLGLIRITNAQRRNIRLVIMNYLMPEEYHIHEKYDLKGSTLGRYATEEEKRDANVTLKDLDFHHKIALPPKKYAMLKEQIEADSQWLRTLRIMDYSILCLLHFPGRPTPFDAECCDDRSSLGSEHTNRASTRDLESEIQSAVGNALKIANDAAVAAGTKAGKSAAEAANDESDDEDDATTVSSLGLPKLTDEDLAAAYDVSRAKSGTLHLDSKGVMGIKLSENRGEGGEEVLVICALIDILQQYGTRKKLEHSFKSIKYRSERSGISVTDPIRYSERFVSFILSKFCAITPEISLAQMGSSSSSRGLGATADPPAAEKPTSRSCVRAMNDTSSTTQQRESQPNQ